MKKIRSYSALMQIPSFLGRFEYLRIGGYRNMERFYEQRRRNQHFYASRRWKQVRKSIIVRDMGYDLGSEDHPIAGKIIVRDMGYDLGSEDHPIAGKIIVHHINPITLDDLQRDSPSLYDPENLISTSFPTHEAVHYADLYIPVGFREDRRPNDTCPWKEG